MYAMPMTVNTMIAMVTAGLNNSNKRLLESKMVVGNSYLFINLYIDTMGKMDFKTRRGVCWKAGKRKSFFRMGKGCCQEARF